MTSASGGCAIVRRLEVAAEVLKSLKGKPTHASVEALQVKALVIMMKAEKTSAPKLRKNLSEY